jgi:hypothetical protein
MKNVDSIVKLMQSEARDAFSMKADQEFCDLLDYAFEFRKEFLMKRRRAFS